MTGVVYGLYHQDSLIYVGSCADPGARYARHEKNAKDGRESLIYNHIREHGMPEMKIFVEVHDELLRAAEKAYIEEALKHGPLLNVMWNPANSSECFASIWSDEDVRRKRVEGTKRFYRTDEGKKFKERSGKATRERLLGKPGHPNSLRGMREANLGSSKSDETKSKISESLKGQKHTPERRENLLKGRHRNWHVNRGIVKPGCKFCEEL